MTGDSLYIIGTLVQLVAFCRGMSASTLGLALVFYGLGIFAAHQAGLLQ